MARPILVMLSSIILLSSVAADAQEKLYSNEFALGDVSLLDGPFKHARDLNIEVLLSYNVDRLLAPYLKEAGLTPKAASYPNWIGLDGHVGGHYLSALAMNYAATGNAACKQKMDYMISELTACQNEYGTDPNFSGYLGGVPDGKAIWSRIKRGDVGAVWDSWVPWYNVHKMYAGLRDAWLYGGSSSARTMFLKFCDWGISLCANLTDNQMQSMLGNEHGGINEIYADAYQMTNDPKYLSMAKKLSHRTILNSMSSGVDNLDNLHANTQVPKAVGLQRIAEVDNDNTYYRAARFFWETVTEKRSLAFGGNSRREHFPSAADCIDYTTEREGPETCNSHNMLKLAEGLFRMTSDARYADYYERTLFNHILSSQHPTHGGYVYFTPARPRHYRVYSAPNAAMWCCVGTGMENHGKYNQFIYTHNNDSLFVNLFVASELNWREKGVQIKQETRFPDEERTELTISTVSPTPFTLLIRHPSWIPAGDMKVIVGADTLSSQSQPPAYFQIDRAWNNGDIVTVLLPMRTTIEEMPNVSSYVALMHGPILLGAKTGTRDMSGLIADDSRWGHIAHGSLYALSGAPVLLGTRTTIPSKLVRDNDEQMSFMAPELFGNWTGSQLVLQPFFRIHDSRYMIYWTTERSSNDDEEEALILDRRTIDKVAPGEQQPEVDHQLQSLNSQTGSHQGEFYRDAGTCSGGDGGFFSYNLLTNKEPDISLMVRYWGNEGCTRTFDILIDGERLVTENIVSKWNRDEFVTVEYPIPNSMVAGKDAITVRFQATSGMVGGVFYVRILKKDLPVDISSGPKGKNTSPASVLCMSDGSIKFSFDKKDPLRTVSIFSLSGKRVAHFPASGNVLWKGPSSHKTNNGMYIIHIFSGRTVISKTVSVVKQ